MAKGKYRQWLEPDNLLLLEGWARDGLTDEQIAHNMNIATSTLYVWKLEHPEIAEVLKRTKEVVDYEVENALYRAAMSGNVTAQIFWLKNRRADRWRDKVADNQNDMSITINHSVPRSEETDDDD